MIRVLVADDSATVRALLVDMLASDPEITVVGEARDGEEAVEMAARLRPDLVTMDVHMPALDGLSATREIMIRAPTPIIVISSRAGADLELALNATRAGALTVLPAPDGPCSAGFAEGRERLLRTAKAMAAVKVVRHWRGAQRLPVVVRAARGVRLVAIAASTGGPAALHRVLHALPRDFPAPVLITQHMAPGFVQGLAAWLDRSTALAVRVAADGEPLQPGAAYLAPDDRHLGAERGRVLLSDCGPLAGFCPSANFLFETVARSHGSGAVGVILTGMGSDGVAGLRALRAAGGHVIAQDEASAVVYGMPKEAVRAGVVDAVVPLDGIAATIEQLVRGRCP